MQYQLAQHFGENLPTLVQRIQSHSMSPMQIDVILEPSLTPFHQGPVALNGQMFLDIAACIMAFSAPPSQKIHPADLPTLDDIKKGNI